MKGYFVNTNNYVPCKDCVEGYDKQTMLCTKAYYYHTPTAAIKHKHLPITGITTA